MAEDKNKENNTITTGENQMAEIKTASEIGINIGAEFTILRADLTAILQKTGKKWQVLVSPTDTIANQGMTIGEIVSEIQSLMGGESSQTEGLEDKLQNTVASMASEESQSSFDPKAIKLYLRQVFVYYEKDDKASAAEYAFSLEVDTSQMLKNIGMFNLKKICFAVWNTERQGVKEKMALLDINEYLRAMA